MEFIYVTDIKYEEKNFFKRIFNFLFSLFKGYARVYINDEIYNSKFKRIGYIICMDKKDVNKQKYMLEKIAMEKEIKLLCFADCFKEYLDRKNLSFDISFGDDARFLFLFRKFKREVPEEKMVGAILGKNIDERYVTMVCKNYPLVIFFTKYLHDGENISQRLSKNIGSSIYVTKLDRSLSKMGGIIDLSNERFTDLNLNIPCLIDFYNNNYFNFKRRLYNFNVKANGIFTNEKKINLYDASIIEGLVYIEKNIYLKEMFFVKDINAIISGYKCKLAFNP